MEKSAQRRLGAQSSTISTPRQQGSTRRRPYKLHLYNLMYEKSYYVKAIKACKDFKSKYPDIDLVPQEQFFRDAPKDIKDSILSNDVAHNLMS
ncbi:THO complex subunit 5B [Stylosanthes scabra]|uniref:THO complex subunit 5B n=1 Tax=Stylosanthes scabra TaxID=79078 RepID=A0ABU6XM18_9FABA|nr:THO complex subunit 5B [Stylosanthes scabra]